MPSPLALVCVCACVLESGGVNAGAAMFPVSLVTQWGFSFFKKDP